MIRLREAHFCNFRLLRDVTLPFSIDPVRRLTVIRADNESGKTTALRGLAWALFGESALPAGGTSFRLHPIDVHVDRVTTIDISVEVIFDLVTGVPMGGVPEVETYRLSRATSEEVTPGADQFKRLPTTLEIVKLTADGERPISNPTAFLDAHIPAALRDVFFTDGDRALTFIEASASASTKRQRVEKAIRSLLGLDILEAAIKHLDQVASDLSIEGAKIAAAGRGNDGIKEHLADLQSRQSQLLTERDTSAATVSATDEELRETRKQVELAIARGGADRETLIRRKSEIEARVRVLRSRLQDLRKQQSQLTSDSSIAFMLLGESLGQAVSALEALKNRGEIPKNFKPLLEERLELGECICGSSLATGTQLREHLLDVVRRQGEQDYVRGHLMELLYVARPWISDDAKGRWVRRLVGLYRDFAGVQRDLEAHERDLAEHKLRIDQIGNTDLPLLRESEQLLQARNKEARESQIRAETSLRATEDRLDQVNKTLASALKIDEKGQIVLARKLVAEDILSVLNSALLSIKTAKVDEVSSVTNELFMQMIKADPEGSVIRGCEVTREFDIRVYGPGGKALDPDRDVNGASRRALTLAFVMALTRVSGVEAPLVIDTPLGMMSPEIKREVLRAAVENAGQLVLFLTRSEIRDIEPQLDAYAGLFRTLSNSSHYPAMLCNEPPVEGLQTMACECSHRTACSVCQRRDNAVELAGAGV